MLTPRICLPMRPGAPITIECPDHGPMTWQAMAYRCQVCPVSVTEADMARLARWLAGERIPGADCGR